MKTKIFNNREDLFIFLVENEYIYSVSQFLNGYGSPGCSYRYTADNFNCNEKITFKGLEISDRENDGSTTLCETLRWKFYKDKPSRIQFYGSMPVESELTEEYVHDIYNLPIFSDLQREEFKSNGDIEDFYFDYSKKESSIDFVVNGIPEDKQNILLAYLNNAFKNFDFVKCYHDNGNSMDLEYGAFKDFDLHSDYDFYEENEENFTVNFDDKSLSISPKFYVDEIISDLIFFQPLDAKG